MGHSVNIAEMTDVQTSNQIQLYESFLNRDMKLFINALERGANPLMKYPDHKLCVLYEALQTPVCSEFIREALSRNFETKNATNFCYKAVKYICLSEDLDNFKVFFNTCSIDPADVYLNLFLLNNLIKKLNDDNVAKLKQFIEIVFIAGVSANITDRHGMTPLHNVVRNNALNYENKCQVIKIFLARGNIDIDTFDQGELRNILVKEYPDIRLPQIITVFESLNNCIKAREYRIFEERYQDYLSNISANDNFKLLINAIENENHNAFDIIFPNFLGNATKNDISFAVQKSFGCENNHALEVLLKVIINDKELYLKLLAKLFRKMHSCAETNNALYQRYIVTFERFLDSSQINPFHNANEFHKYDLIKSVLRKGANITSGYSLHLIPPSLLEEHLDECVSSTGNSNEMRFKIIISFKNFQTNYQKKQKKEQKLPELLQPIIANNDQKKKVQKILPSIALMANSSKHRYLLQHPIITSILQLLWQKVAHIFYINFLLCLFVIGSITTHVVLNSRVSSNSTALIISKICSYLGICYLIAREYVQFIIAPQKYLKYFSNYMEILLIIFSLLSCWYKNEDIQVACILLLAYELFSLVGSLPIDSISMHMLMLETVCISFVKCYLFYSIFILTFALCFYIKSNPDSDEEFHSFSNPLKAFFKTIVMLIGEIDASNLNLDSPYSWLLFLVFILFMSIILFNLLNGLAVSDTQKIRNQAELSGAISRFNSLMIFENVVFWHCHIKCFFFINKLLAQLASGYTIDEEVAFLPNCNNEILCNLYNDDASWFSSIFYNTKPTIDKNTSAKALEILKKKSTKSLSEKLDLVLQKLSKEN